MINTKIEYIFVIVLFFSFVASVYCVVKINTEITLNSVQVKEEITVGNTNLELKNGVIENTEINSDILIKGNDDGLTIDMVSFDSSEKGYATLNDGVHVKGELKIGSGAASGTIKSNGDQDLVLQTGNTTTGSITITDGADGDITLAPNGSGNVIFGNSIRYSTEDGATITWNTTVSSITSDALLPSPSNQTERTAIQGLLKIIILDPDTTLTVDNKNYTSNSSILNSNIAFTFIFIDTSWFLISASGPNSDYSVTDISTPP